MVITGVAPICSVGVGKEEVWKGILNKQTGLELVNYKVNNEFIGEFYKHRADRVNIENIGLDQRLLDEMRIWKKEEEGRDLACMIKATHMALEDSLLEVGHGREVGIVASHENIGLESFCSSFFNQLLKVRFSKFECKTTHLFHDFFLTNSRRAYELQNFMPLYHITKLFNIHGYSLFINNACSSGLYAMEAARQTILSGKNKVVIVVASDYQDIFKTLWLNEANLYCEDGFIKPFDINRNGFVSGEGGAAIVMEERSHAEKRRARIYAEFLGGGFSQDCWKVSLPQIDGSFLSQSIRDALDNAEINIKRIDLISAHAVGTQINDKYEANTILEVFKGSTLDIPVCAFKPYIGHNLGGSSLLETVLTLLVMEKGIVPGALNTMKIDPKLKINLMIQTTKLKIKQSLKICSGFGGYNSAIVLRRAT